MKQNVRYRNKYVVECIGATGNEKWREETENIVVNQGLDHTLAIITITAHVTAWYVGLTASGSTFAAADTPLSHAGWTEVTHYSEANRPAYTAGAISSQSVDNSGSPAAFSITSATTIGGAFMISRPTKGGTQGMLFGGATFAARSVVASDTVNVTITVGTEVT